MPEPPVSVWAAGPWPLHTEKNLGWAGLGPYLGRVVQVERLVEAEVDEAQQCGVELSEGGHDPVVNICRVLQGTGDPLAMQVQVGEKTALATPTGGDSSPPKAPPWQPCLETPTP